MPPAEPLVQTRRRTSTVGLWAGLVLALGWTVLWGLVAWTAWQDSGAERDLISHGTATSARVTAAAPGEEFKLGWCQQTLQVTTVDGAPLTISAIARCARPWTAGAWLPIVVDPHHPAHAVPADTVPSDAATRVVPVVVAATAALLAGVPLGRLLSAVERRRDEAWHRELASR